MSQDYNNLPKGNRVQTQIPLDVKEYSLNESTLSYLGLNDNLAFTYNKGLVVYCIEENTRWEWNEVEIGEENSGLLPLDFTYPDNHIVFNIDYSNKKYNFKQTNLSGAQGPQGVPGPQGPQGEPGIDATYSLISSDTTNITGSGTLADPYKVDFKNLQKNITEFPYFLNNNDNFNTLFIDNSFSNVIIYVPDNLISNFTCVLIQKGVGTVSITEMGSSIINTPIGQKLKSQYSHCLIEKENNTSNYYLIGNLKI